MKNFAVSVVFSVCQLAAPVAQADDYCYSWDCNSNGNSLSGQENRSDMNDSSEYGDKVKEHHYSDAMKTSKLKALQIPGLKVPSTCDKRSKNNPLPCGKLY